MRRLIIINTILIILIANIPIKDTIQKEKDPQQETKQEIKEEIKEEIKQEVKEEVKEEKPKNEITSRTMENKREILKISARGIELIKKYEGCKLTAYRLPNERFYTIGYGHYGADIKAGQQITQVQAENLLKNDLERYEGYVRAECKHLNLNQNEFDALVSFTYNCGQGNLKKLVRNRNKNQIADKITNYTRSGSERNRSGLKRRRIEERKIFKGE